MREERPELPTFTTTMYALNRLLSGLFLSSLFGCSALVSVAHEPADASTLDVSPADVSSPPADVSSPPADVSSPPTDASLPPVDAAPTVDLPVVEDVAEGGVMRPTTPLAFHFEYSDGSIEGSGGSVDFFEDGEIFSMYCGGLTGGCSESLLHLTRRATDLLALRASMEATGFLDVAPGEYIKPMTVARSTLDYQRAGVHYVWVMSDSFAPMPVQRAVGLLTNALRTAVPAP